MLKLAKFKKYVEYVQIKIKAITNEKRFYGKNYRLKYMLEENDSDTLIIIFSSCTRVGIKARYNYGRTLKDLKVNKLFILDDFGYDQRGAYYLGHDLDLEIQDIVTSLINTIQEKLNINKNIYVGSSKGGYAALYFGLQQKNSIIIAGAPQYYLGNYLNSNDHNRENCLKYIVGKEITDEKLHFINYILPNRVNEYSDNNNSIYLHFSDMESTYKHHVKDLITDLEKNKYGIKLDIEKYTDHSDVSLFFTKYLIQTINQVI